MFERVPRERVYELTGVQLMPINTLYQLYAMVRDGSPAPEVMTDLLFMPDLLGYLLSGRKAAEFTIASTSQLYNPTKGEWAAELFEALGLPVGLMQEIVEPGTVIGSLETDIGRRVGLGETPVIAGAGHDTAAAVAAAPAEGRDWAYISSGTWSLMGVESQRPIITQESFDFNFTNEGGVGGTFRVLKNIMGLWLVQQCRKSWAKERMYSYEELTEMAAGEEEVGAIIDPDHGAFLNPPDMPEAIAAFCESTGQEAPGTPAALVRCVLVSLALKYRLALDQLRRLYDHPINRIHVIGGGVRNELLCQLTADATGVPVIAGPVEATAIGNILVQAMALGQVESPAAIREIVRRSFPVVRYEPRGAGQWEDPYRRLCELMEQPGTQEDAAR
jgi:rhamnulokinase